MSRRIKNNAPAARGIAPYRKLCDLYVSVRNAYSEKTNFVADLANKTKRLIQESAEQHGLGGLTKSVTFDVKTLETLRREKGSDEGKIFNLFRGLQKEIDENSQAAAVLQPFKERAERILKDLEDRKTSGLAAMDQLAALAAEKEEAMKAAKASGLSPPAFAVAWALREDKALAQAAIKSADLAKTVEDLRQSLPNITVNPEEMRTFRSRLYVPLIALPKDERKRIVETIMKILTAENGE